MFHGVIQKITLAQFFLRHGVESVNKVVQLILSLRICGFCAHLIVIKSIVGWLMQ